jgi:ribosome biogenesis ATPase
VVVKRGKDVEGVDGAADGPPQFDGRPTARYDDLGGVDEALRAVRELVEYPLTHPEIYEHLGVDPPRGILLHGPPGCGKTLLANAIAGELGETVSFHKVGATELVSSQSGASEKRIRDLFDDAAAQAPALIFIDEIDAIAAKRDNAGSTMERRMVAQLLTSLDGLTLAATGGEAVIVLAATNRPDALDNALRRSGRFDREIVMPIPDEAARERILRKLTERMALAESIDLAAIARNTPGYVGADLEALTREAAVCSVHRVFSDLFVRPDISIAAAEPAEKPKPSSSPSSSAAAQDDDDDDDDDDFDLAEPSPAAASSSAATPDASSSATAPTTVQSNSSARLDREAAAAAEMSDFATVSKRLRGVGRLTSEHLDRLAVSEADFEVALTKVQPTATREGFATVPNVTWADVGSLDEVREELRLAIVEPIRRPEVYEDLGLSIPAGVLLFGPPGCGKTLLAKAIANQSQANFISVKGPELLDKYVGESERAVRQVFTRARASAPCIIFFDELDALAPRRGSGGGGGGVSERVVNQLLTELDGLEARRDVYVVAATNRPDMIDPAMLRPGRLDKLLFVPLPDADGRASIIKTHTRKTPIGPGVDVSKVARDARCDRFSGADLAGLVREAALSALRERLASEEGPEAAAGSSPRSSAHVHVVVQASHFERALSRVRPSVSRADQKLYNSMERRLRNARATVAKEGAAGAADEGAGVPAAAPVDDGKRGVTMKR